VNCDVKHLKGIHKLAKKLKVSYWRINRYRPIGRDNKDQLSLNKDDLKKSYSFFSSLAKKDFVMPDPLFSLLGKRVNYCPCGKTSFRIQSSGEVTPCIYLHESGGNIMDKPIDMIFESDVFKAIRGRTLKDTKCEQCAHVKECNGGCAGSAYLTHGIFDEADPLCWHENHTGDNEWNVHEKYLCTAYIPIGE
jgi:radical SAM protein with 4Fe4S-binding SPASM domain